MRLQKQVNKKVGNTTYDKYVVVVKPELVEELGWKGGQELEASIKEKKLILASKPQ